VKVKAREMMSIEVVDDTGKVIGNAAPAFDFTPELNS